MGWSEVVALWTDGRGGDVSRAFLWRLTVVQQSLWMTHSADRSCRNFGFVGILFSHLLTHRLDLEDRKQLFPLYPIVFVIAQQLSQKV